MKIKGLDFGGPYGPVKVFLAIGLVLWIGTWFLGFLSRAFFGMATMSPDLLSEVVEEIENSIDDSPLSIEDFEIPRISACISESRLAWQIESDGCQEDAQQQSAHPAQILAAISALNALTTGENGITYADVSEERERLKGDDDSDGWPEILGYHESAAIWVTGDELANEIDISVPEAWTVRSEDGEEERHSPDAESRLIPQDQLHLANAAIRLQAQRDTALDDFSDRFEEGVHQSFAVYLGMGVEYLTYLIILTLLFYLVRTGSRWTRILWGTLLLLAAAAIFADAALERLTTGFSTAAERGEGGLDSVISAPFLLISQIISFVSTLVASILSGETIRKLLLFGLFWALIKHRSVLVLVGVTYGLLVVGRWDFAASGDWVSSVAFFPFDVAALKASLLLAVLSWVAVGGAAFLAVFLLREVWIWAAEPSLEKVRARLLEAKPSDAADE